MTIYEIDQRLLDLVDPETGELLDLEAFEELHLDRADNADKVEGMALWYKNLCAKAAAIKAEADNLIKRSRSLDRQANRLKEYIGEILGGAKLSTARCVISYHPSTSLEVSDPAALIEWAQKCGHDNCLSYKPPEISKTNVRKLIEDGVDVPAAQIVKKKNVRIS